MKNLEGNMEIPKQSYLKAVDAIRSIAVLAVLLYHLDSDRFVGGYFGVVIFFVMAGYLSMYQLRNRDDFFWFEKIKQKYQKLLPALVSMIFGVGLYLLIRFPEFFDSFKWASVTSILGIHNLAQIWSGSSYFENMALIKPLTHIWALSLELQFYAVFYFFAEHFSVKKYANAWKIGIILVLFLSFGWSLWLYQPNIDPSRVYYGTDTRVYSFLIGAMIAMLPHCPGKWKAWKNIVFLTMTVMVLVPIFLFPPTASVYYYGFLLYSVIVGGWLYLSEETDLMGIQFFSGEIFREISNRSYLIYLWHYPLILLYRREVATWGLSYFYYFSIQIILILLLSELNYQLFRKEKMMKLWNQQLKMAVSLLLLLLAFMPVNLAKEETQNAELIELQQRLAEGEKEAELAEQQPAPIVVGTNTESKIISLPQNPAENEGIQSVYVEVNKDEEWLKMDDLILKLNERYPDSAISLEDYAKYRMSYQISLIGDSMSTISRKSYLKFFPNMIIEAKGNRRIDEGAKVLETLITDGKLRNVLVCALGTNCIGPLKDAYYDDMQSQLHGQKMVLVSVGFPTNLGIHTSRNDFLASYIAKNPKLYLADWGKYTLEHDNEDILAGDMIHPSIKGMDVYSFVIARQVIDALKALDAQAGIVKKIADLEQNTDSLDNANLENRENPFSVKTVNELEVTDLLPTSMKFSIKNQSVSCESYFLNGRSYYKIRDIAWLLSQTSDRFEVLWKDNKIHLFSKKPYTAVGGELSLLPVFEKGVLQNLEIVIDGKPEQLETYLVKNNYYVQLRDLCQKVGIPLQWNEKEKVIILGSENHF